MLVLNRKVGECIILDDNIKITLVQAQDGRAKIGIDAPLDVTILRKELYDEVIKENKDSVKEDSEEILNILKDMK